MVPGWHDLSKEAPMLNIPSGRFLCPYIGKLWWLEPLRLRRIKSEMTFAARQGQGYHLWWHPHNFGVNLKENLTFLRRVLDHFRSLRNSWGMQSVNMVELSRGVLGRMAP
jgi:hypothetical protein